MESEPAKKDMKIPGQLLGYLVFFWLAAANVGADIALLLNASRGAGIVLLLAFLVVSSIVTAWMGTAIVRFHLRGVERAGEEDIPEMV